MPEGEALDWLISDLWLCCLGKNGKNEIMNTSI